jgi:oligoendopeptidase F
MYDLYVPLVDEISSDIEYDKAVEMVLEGIKPLGENYLELMKKGLNEGWIDIYENRGKRKGAYSWGSYGTHPYVLLNYNSTLRDVFTLAHEMGHALHSWFSHSSQPYIYGDYTIFLAEVASTTNEALLIEHLLSVTDDVEEKKYLLNYYLEQIRTTVYRQTLFAEFEKKTHEFAESGQALTKDLMCDLWHSLNEKYYGPSIVVDEDIDIEWARIPHFYSSFYVYQYVTGYAAATAFSRKILSGEPGARKAYLDFLKMGSSDYSVNILKTAGVDMTVPAPLEQTLDVFRDKLEQLKGLL